MWSSTSLNNLRISSLSSPNHLILIRVSLHIISWCLIILDKPSHIVILLLLVRLLCRIHSLRWILSNMFLLHPLFGLLMLMMRLVNNHIMIVEGGLTRIGRSLVVNCLLSIGDDEGILTGRHITVFGYDSWSEDFIRYIKMLAFQEAIQFFSQEPKN